VRNHSGYLLRVTQFRLVDCSALWLLLEARPSVKRRRLFPSIRSEANLVPFTALPQSTYQGSEPGAALHDLEDAKTPIDPTASGSALALPAVFATALPEPGVLAGDVEPSSNAVLGPHRGNGGKASITPPEAWLTECRFCN